MKNRIKKIEKIVDIENAKGENLGELSGGQIPPATFRDPLGGSPTVIQLNYPEKI